MGSFVRLTRRGFAAIALLSTLPGPLLAAPNWPTRPVTIVVPFTAGGSTDVIARLLGQKLSEMWGQSVVVENRVGAGGNIGTALVAKAAADGHTLLMASGSIFTVNPHLYKRLPFQPREFAPITKVASGPMLVVVPASSPAKNLQELVAIAKAAPRSVNFGSAGIGSQVHMAGENFANAAGIDLVHVPYKGEAAAYTDLMAGQVQVVVGNIAAAGPLVNGGRLRALAVTGKERSRMMPDVPTVSESGIPGFENSGWFGLMAPAGTPRDVIAKIQADTARVLASPEVRTKLDEQGMAPIADKPDEFARAIEEESLRWSGVVRARKLSAE
jgi:tripartite-type tricarboxylate transporter receptor subunit TctC